MERRRLKPVRLFSSDLDGTLAGHRAASRRFADFWNSLDAATRPLLVYNSGRLVNDMIAFGTEEGLPPADLLIGGVGTMLAAEGMSELGREYAGFLAGSYDADRIAALVAPLPDLERQPERYQHERKSSWFLEEASPERLQDLADAFNRNGLQVKIVYSSNRDLDILPANADKGNALIWLCRKLGYGLDEVVVAGDTGNDSDMFALDGVRGILPANARNELRERFAGRDHVFEAAGREADGVIQGLRHWMEIPAPAS